ncbi:MAG: hypothetical protein IT330_17880 [Anaerolineae bacterium]|nr:hypothetical protein [Anaerolineae bacterium]
MHATTASPTTKPEDMLKSRAWTERHFARAADLPISFVLDGKTVRGIPEAWHPTSSWRLIDANITEMVFAGTDAATGLSLQVVLTQYLDYPAVEWVAWFTNTGTTTTPIIRDILALDGDFRGSSPVLYHCNGDYYSAEGYTSQETALTAGSVMSFAPNGGRSCDGAFPYYRITFAGWGLSLAIGWPAQWAARFAGQADGVHVRAGQEKTNLRLAPGETIRTPRLAVLFWSGDSRRGVNLWRRWYLAHLLPRPNGQPLRP